MTTLGHCEVRITCGSREEATTIANALVTERLVACAHLVPISSVFEWNQVIEIEPNGKAAKLARDNLDRIQSILDVEKGTDEQDQE